MTPFSLHRGILAPLDRANVDTDQIIPKQFLKSIQRTGFGESLFFDWRYGADGKPDPSFILNRAPYDRSSILVTRNNFGCGSSREHAVWAVAQFGFKAVLAPSVRHGDSEIPGFADIFRNNCVKNGVLTVELQEADIDEIFKRIEATEGLEATIDLPSQKVVLHGDEEVAFPFDIDPGTKDTLIRGLDDIAQTLEHADVIDAFESTHDALIHRAG